MYVCMYVCMLSRFRNVIVHSTHAHTMAMHWPDPLAADKGYLLAKRELEMDERKKELFRERKRKQRASAGAKEVEKCNTKRRRQEEPRS